MQEKIFSWGYIVNTFGLDWFCIEYKQDHVKLISVLIRLNKWFLKINIIFYKIKSTLKCFLCIYIKTIFIKKF